MHNICLGWQALGQWRVNWKGEIPEGNRESTTNGTGRAEWQENHFWQQRSYAPFIQWEENNGLPAGKASWFRVQTFAYWCSGLGEEKHINLCLLSTAGTRIAIENQWPFFQKLGVERGRKRERPVSEETPAGLSLAGLFQQRSENSATSVPGNSHLGIAT